VALGALSVLGGAVVAAGVLAADADATGVSESGGAVVVANSSGSTPVTLTTSVGVAGFAFDAEALLLSGEVNP
jgi:hypothetical protein